MWSLCFAQQPGGVVERTGESRRKILGKVVVVVFQLFCAQQRAGVVEQLFLRTPIFDFHTAIQINHAVYCIQGNFSEAEPLFERCQAIQEKVLGPEHPSLATTLNNRALLSEEQVRATKNFLESSCGTRLISGVLSNRAELLRQQVRVARKIQEFS